MTAHLFALDNMSRAMQGLLELQRYEQKLLLNSTDISTDDGHLVYFTKDCSDDDDHVSTDDAGTFWFRLDIFGLSLSFISLSFISYAILSDKRVRSHPNDIIAFICLCDAYTYCQYLNRYFICAFDLNTNSDWLFGATFLEPL